jgi:tetratricopeptide (TPR) repeat protein
MKRLEEAEDVFLRASKKDAFFWDPLLGLAHSQFYQGKYEAARKAYQEVLIQVPDNQEALEGLEQIRLLGKDFER